VEFLIIGVVALIAIAMATTLGPRIGVAAPLILVALGVAVSLIPGVPEVEIDPEIILAGVLPPLLYAAGVSIPATDFRREFKSIGALSVVLTIVSTVLLGALFHAIIPDLAWPWAFALGAIVSPSDPVATAIIKRLGVSPRVVSLLEGESLLNDATALVLLRGAVAAAASAVTVWTVAWQFVVAMALAVAIGWIVARINLWVSARIRDTTANTVFTFTVPFLASIPAELVGASGLVAAVVAGLVTGNGAARALSPQVRQSDHQTWRAIELMLEGAIYLILGLELIATIEDVERDHAGVGFALSIAAITLVAVLTLRAAFIAPLLAGQARRARRAAALIPHIEHARTQLEDPDTSYEALRRMVGRLAGRARSEEHAHRRLTRAEADISYLLRAPLGPREGALMVWAGMRGVVTVAAAQTLPTDTPGRSLLVLIAYFVAIGSLVIQGGTVAWAVRLLKPSRGATPQEEADERARLRDQLDTAAADARAAFRDGGTGDGRTSDDSASAGGSSDGGPSDGGSGRDSTGVGDTAERLAVIHAQRDALLDARSLGTFSSATLSAMLTELDHEQIRLEL